MASRISRFASTLRLQSLPWKSTGFFNGTARDWGRVLLCSAAILGTQCYICGLQICMGHSMVPSVDADVSILLVDKTFRFWKTNDRVRRGDIVLAFVEDKINPSSSSSSSSSSRRLPSNSDTEDSTQERSSEPATGTASGSLSSFSVSAESAANYSKTSEKTMPPFSTDITETSRVAVGALEYAKSAQSQDTKISTTFSKDPTAAGSHKNVDISNPNSGEFEHKAAKDNRAIEEPQIQTSEQRGVCKRVLGLPGDIVCVDPTIGQSEWRTVPAGHVWLAGDNFLHSVDSRVYGAQPLSNVNGRVLAQIYPRPKWLAC